MSQDSQDGVSLESNANTGGTIRHYHCQHCGRMNEVRWVGYVPSSYYNVVRDYVRAAAGDEFVLLPVATLNAMGEERERLARELEASRA